MPVTHHLSDDTLLDYASGALSERIETLIACHLTVCPECRKRAEFFDALGGEVMEMESSSTMSASAADVLARAAAAPAHSAPVVGHTPKVVQHDPDVPRPLARLLPDKLESLPWRTIAPGIKQYNLSESPRRDGAFKLLHLAPGTVLSEHTHTDRELTYVVRGSYTDQLGRFAAGDIADLDGDHQHKPVVDSSEPCIALIATHAPVRFNSLFGKMIQPFVGI